MYIITKNVRNILSEALVELLKKQRIEAITVNAIVKASGISSRTFYNYFTDKYDLMHYTYYLYLESCRIKDGRLANLPEAFTQSVESPWVNDPTMMNVALNMAGYVGQNDLRSFVLASFKHILTQIVIANGCESQLEEVEMQQMIFMLACLLNAIGERYSLYPREKQVTAETLLLCVPDKYRQAFAGIPEMPAQPLVFDPENVAWPPPFMK